jgi:protein TonB
MKPEHILQADLLDIIFLGRNKEYGAYTLRKYYASRLLHSFGVTFLLVLSLVIVNQVKSNFSDKIPALAVVPVHDVHLSNAPEPEKKKEVIKEIKKPLRQLAHKAYVVPKIVKDDIADKNLPEVKELENKIISNIDKTGNDVSNDELIVPVNDKGKGGEGQAVEKPAEVIEPTAPLVKAEVMPEFPGGMEAFKKFMLRNLRQPDLNEGEKIIVRVQFVVDADGSIKNMHILQSGGGLDNEVIRVVAKMPKWKPGIQNGRFVAVYFTLPVTFMGPDS